MSYSHLVVLLLSTTLVVVYTIPLCPSGCRCTTDDDTGKINVICERLTDFPVSLPSRTAQLQILHSNLHAIPENAFSKSPEIQSIYIRFSTVEIISSRAFTNVRKLEDIEFQRSNITRFESFSFLDINVSSISILYNNIDEIEAHAFSGITADDQVVCFNNFIRELGPASFSHVQEAKLFQFQANTVTSVGDNCFTNFSSIDTFDFSNNHFLRVEPQSYNSERIKMFIMFKNDINCDCKISWIFKTPFFARFTDYNYCADAQEVSLSAWYSDHQPLCKSTMTNDISPKSTSSTRSTSTKIIPLSSPKPTPALSKAPEIITTVSSTPSHSKRTSQNTYTQISIQKITDRQSTSISSSVTIAITTNHSGNEESNSSQNSKVTNAPPRQGSRENVGWDVRAGVLTTLMACLTALYL